MCVRGAWWSFVCPHSNSFPAFLLSILHTATFPRQKALARLANEMQWQEIGLQEKGKARDTLPPLSALLASGSDCVSLGAHTLARPILLWSQPPPTPLPASGWFRFLSSGTGD